MPPIHHHKRAELVEAGDCERVFFLYRLLDIMLLFLTVFVYRGLRQRMESG